MQDVYGTLAHITFVPFCTGGNGGLKLAKALELGPHDASVYSHALSHYTVVFAGAGGRDVDRWRHL